MAHASSHPIGDDVRRLLRIESTESLITSLIERTMLDAGRFEAHEFGRQEHSAASAGAALIGYATLPTVAVPTLAKMYRAAAALVSDTGSVRGHGDGPSIDNSWRLSQLLLGLLVRPSLAIGMDTKLAAMASSLVNMQDSDSGGWGFRPRSAPSVVFTFYPVAALTRGLALGIYNRAKMTVSLNSATRYLYSRLTSRECRLEEQLLAARAIHLAGNARFSALPTKSWSYIDELERISHESRHGLGLADYPIVIYQQPTWHVIVWRPLLYLACRGQQSPLNPLLAVLANELISTFDTSINAWRGPVNATAPAGVSWASALGLRGVYLLAHDLRNWQVDIAEWQERSSALHADSYEFDVVISFSGVDRSIAERISRVIKLAGYRIFYDRDHQHALLGEDLAQYLQEMYFSKSRYAVAVISRSFMTSKWAGNWEWRAVLARMQSQQESYVLPYLVDDSMPPGMNPTIGYIQAADSTPEEFAQLVVRKLRRSAGINGNHQR